MYVRLKFSLSPRIHFQTSLEHSISVFHASFQSIEPYSSIKLTIAKWRFLCPLTFLFSKMGGGEIFTDTLVNINTCQKKKSMGFQRAMCTPWGRIMWQPNNWCSSCLASSPWLVESWKHQTCCTWTRHILSFWWKGWNVLKCYSLPPEVGIRIGSSTRFLKNGRPQNWSVVRFFRKMFPREDSLRCFHHVSAAKHGHFEAPGLEWNFLANRYHWKIHMESPLKPWWVLLMLWVFPFKTSYRKISWNISMVFGRFCPSCWAELLS